MFRIKTLTAKNFLSIGNVTQAIDFDRQDLTLVLGRNLDLGGDDTGARNGTGKSTIVNALSYGLYGEALTKIRKENLINKTNEKNMLVTVEFEFNNKSYKIERGRKPNILKFYIENVEQQVNDDNSQGDSRETQQQIERMLGISHDMFKHIVALNTYTEPFLSMKANDQRTMIEQLLGITALSEKADVLKEQTKNTREQIQQEEFRIKALVEANQRIIEQIESLQRRQKLWVTKHAESLQEMQSRLDELEKLDIVAEIAAHRDLNDYNQKKKDINDLTKLQTRAKLDLDREQKQIQKLEKEIKDLTAHKCYACGQDLHDAKHESVLLEKQQALQEATMQFLAAQSQEFELHQALLSLGELGPQPQVYYDKEEDAIHHRSTVTSLQEQLAQKLLEGDPYEEQILEMTESAVGKVDYTKVNELQRLLDHQDFLLKLLTNKDSFIRKTIIEQNLSFLNMRLSHYLDQIGLPHTVVFQNDLTVDITELGRELDFDNLSRGERNRLILSLSWAFRDVWESLYQPINLMFIDEMIDSGMDTSGVEASLKLLKKMSRDSEKSVWLISHKDELASRVNNILYVTKESGYTSYSSSLDIVD
jgi:DNA repair exonuclease SbcCD ATPase subunit